MARQMVKQIAKPAGNYLREVVFGVQDGAIGTLGVVIGLAQAAAPNAIIFLAGITTMVSQAISMSTGNYLSVKSEKDYFSAAQNGRAYGRAYVRRKDPVVSSAAMGFSVVAGAFIPQIAFFFWESQQGIFPSLLMTLAGLFTIGALKTRYTLKNWFRSGMETVLLGCLAGVVGYFVGSLF